MTKAILFYLAFVLLTVLAELRLLKRWHGRRRLITSILCGAVLGGVAGLLYLIVSDLIHGGGSGGLGNLAGNPPGTLWGFLVTSFRLTCSGLLLSGYAILPAAITALIYRRLRAKHETVA